MVLFFSSFETAAKDAIKLTAEVTSLCPMDETQRKTSEECNHRPRLAHNLERLYTVLAWSGLHSAFH